MMENRGFVILVMLFPLYPVSLHLDEMLICIFLKKVLFQWRSPTGMSWHADALLSQGLGSRGDSVPGCSLAATGDARVSETLPDAQRR